MSTVLRMNCRGIKKNKCSILGKSADHSLWLSPLRVAWSHVSLRIGFRGQECDEYTLYKTDVCFCSWLHNHRWFKVKTRHSWKWALEETSTLGSGFIKWSDHVPCLFAFARFHKVLLILESWFYFYVIFENSAMLFFVFWFLTRIYMKFMVPYYEGIQLLLSPSCDTSMWKTWA